MLAAYGGVLSYLIEDFGNIQKATNRLIKAVF